MPTDGMLDRDELESGASWVDERRLQTPGRKKRPGDLGGHAFQRWLADVHARGGRVYLARPAEDHVVAIYPATDGQQTIPEAA